MSTAQDSQFDAYHKWLGIPPAEQPPNLYRLLGLTVLEEDAEVIAAAADRQMAHVKSFATGRYAAYSQELLNELSKARLRLLNPTRKAEYDQELKQILQAKRTSSEQPSRTKYGHTAAPVAPPPAAIVSSSAQSGALPTIKPAVRRRRKKRSDDGGLLMNMVWLVLGLSMLLGLVWLASMLAS